MLTNLLTYATAYFLVYYTEITNLSGKDSLCSTHIVYQHGDLF